MEFNSKRAASSGGCGMAEMKSRAVVRAENARKKVGQPGKEEKAAWLWGGE
jgi:hypothetical protein